MIFCHLFLFSSIYFCIFILYFSSDKLYILSSLTPFIKSFITLSGIVPLYFTNISLLIVGTGISLYSSFNAAFSFKKFYISSLPFISLFLPSAYSAARKNSVPYFISIIELVHCLTSIGSMSSPK